MIGKRNETYIKCGDKIYAGVLKAASGSIILAILQKYYRTISDLENRGNINMRRLHFFAPKLKKHQIRGEHVVLISRNPIERFRSACVEAEKTAEEAILELGTKKMNVHFTPTSTWLINGCKLYKFEDHLEDAVKELGLNWPMQHDVKGKGKPKPVLTEEQIEAVESFYEEDLQLYRSIKKAGQIWTASKTPSVEDVLKFR